MSSSEKEKSISFLSIGTILVNFVITKSSSLLLGRLYLSSLIGLLVDASACNSALFSGE